MEKTVPIMRQKSSSLNRIDSMKEVCKLEDNVDLKSMEALNLEFDPFPIVPTSFDAFSQLQELEVQKRELQEKMTFLAESSTNKRCSRCLQAHYFVSDGNEESKYKSEADRLRRENNKLVLENAYAKKEISNYEKRLREESNFRERLQNELQQLTNTIDLRECSIPSEKTNKPKTLDTNNTNLLQEQLKAYKEDFYAEKREREKLQARNRELQSQLEDAKDSLERQQKKLLLHAQFFASPIQTEYKLHATNPTRQKHTSKSSSVPTSPSNFKHDIRKSGPSLMSKNYYKSNEHISEHSIHSAEADNTKRDLSKSYVYKFDEFDWSTDEDVICKGNERHSFSRQNSISRSRNVIARNTAR